MFGVAITGSARTAVTLCSAPAAAAITFTSGAGAGSGAAVTTFTSGADVACGTAAALLADLRCFTEPVSDASLLFDLEDLEARGLETSAAIADSGAVFSSAFFCVFFEGLLNNMDAIKTQRNIFCIICLAASCALSPRLRVNLAFRVFRLAIIRLSAIPKPSSCLSRPLTGAHYHFVRVRRQLRWSDS
jgi:hypothetical protein